MHGQQNIKISAVTFTAGAQRATVRRYDNKATQNPTVLRI